MIDGVVLTPLKQIFDERGKVMHMLSINTPIFTGFGEIYFSCTYPGVVKAWHLHQEMTTIPHNPSEISRLAPTYSSIPYSWDLKHR